MEPTLGTSSANKFFTDRDPTTSEPQVQAYMGGDYQYKFIIWENTATSDQFILLKADSSLDVLDPAFTWGKLSFSTIIQPTPEE